MNHIFNVRKAFLRQYKTDNRVGKFLRALERILDNIWIGEQVLDTAIRFADWVTDLDLELETDEPMVE